MSAPRDWGYWTEQKLEILQAYLPAFTSAAKNRASGKTVYLDLFAGGTENISRTSGEEISGSPRVALNTEPPFTKVILFELAQNASRLESELVGNYPDRDITVVQGDCNAMVEKVLDSLHADDLGWAPTFALVDQYAAEVTWATLEKLAAHKKGSRFKTELWLLFAHAMLPRGLGGEAAGDGSRYSDRVDAMYGTTQWRAAHQARHFKLLTAAALRTELVNLMRWRLEEDLGYDKTHTFDMKNTTGSPLYTMIFATDNQAGDDIMSAIYAKAAQRQPVMRQEAKDAKRERSEKESGVMHLFALPDAEPEPAPGYEHIPPESPYPR